MNVHSPQRSMPVRPANGTGSNSASTLFAPSAASTPAKERTTKLAHMSSGRSRSVDQGAHMEELEALPIKPRKDKGQPQQSHQLPPYRKNNNSSFFGGFGSSSSKAADGLGKASRGFLHKLTRSGSSTDKAGHTGPEEEYEPRILKLPLIEQTRQTRIAKSYDHCRDKTEFWMPALPWRCIDYLNGKCEEEGLYRVSGGLSDIRKWRRRFDTEGDINLLDETDLYDASVIASLFKEWIRELPEEIFPKNLQHKIAASLPTEHGKGPVPQVLRDELSNLPPFNYYLLFAITCHLSLLLSQEAKNKMTLDNLYRCFNQSLKLDGRVFYTLVGDWRQCWQGRCNSENEYLRAEYNYLQAPFPLYPNSDMEDKPPTPSSESVHSAKSRESPGAEDVRPTTAHTVPSHAAVDDTEPESADLLSPGRKQQRSSSDATGASPMKTRGGVNPH